MSALPINLGVNSSLLIASSQEGRKFTTRGI